MDEQVPIGTRVAYWGSLSECHGFEFEVSGYADTDHTPSEYPGGVAYTLVSVEHRGKYLMNVRRTSFEVVE